MATPETTLRLKSVLEILADAHRAGSRRTGHEVVTEALLRVPPTDHEQVLLSGGVPRGFKSLATATARLVKAGWITKGRGGWAITEEGQRAAERFADPRDLVRALDGGIALPGAAPAALPGAPAELSVVPDGASPSPASRQPSAVALVGDFTVLLGADGNWDPRAEQAQMSFDAADGLWKLGAELPAGTYAFKFAIDGSWAENYGAFGLRDGANHELRHGGGALVFAYDHATRDTAAGTGFIQQPEVLASA
ncbi:glycosidase [Micrococcaceae bacterium RIT802]|nr:glycosidase [Micrococcaceae bacterium RIT 802]